MKQPGLERLRESLSSRDPLDIVNAFICTPAIDMPMLPDYWEHRICALAELIAEKNCKRRRKPMAIKVIDEGPDPSVVKRTVCRNCGAKLEYVPMDVQHRTYKDYDGCSDEYHWIECPKCKEEVMVKA